jgi:hypothetical protein
VTASPQTREATTDAETHEYSPPAHVSPSCYLVSLHITSFAFCHFTDNYRSGAPQCHKGTDEINRTNLAKMTLTAFCPISYSTYLFQWPSTFFNGMKKVTAITVTAVRGRLIRKIHLLGQVNFSYVANIITSIYQECVNKAPPTTGPIPLATATKAP